MENVGLNNFWLDRPVLVTGATGLVGGWLVRQLVNAGADVVCLVRDWVPKSELFRTGLNDHVRIVRGDLSDQPLMERVLGEYEVRSVMHLGAQTIVGIANRNPVSTFESNITGTWKLLEACRRSPQIEQIVLASSDKAYGDVAELPCTEETPLAGRSPYEASKSCSDLIAQSYAFSYQLPIVVTRCGNFFGGGDLNWNRIVPGTIRSILRGEAPVIRTDGQFIRDYLYVEDGAAAYMKIVEGISQCEDLRGHAFNFSNEARVSVVELVEKIISLMGSDLKPNILGEASNEIREQYLSSSKARKILKWKPLFDLEEGLSRTIQWYRNYLTPIVGKEGTVNFYKHRPGTADPAAKSA